MSRRDGRDLDTSSDRHRERRSDSSRDYRSSSSKDSKSRDSKDHKDRELKDYKKSDRKERDRDDSPKKSEDGEGGGGGDIELDIEATNRIRISLGLKPLNVESKKKEKEESEAKKVKDIEDASKERDQLKLRAKIEKSKEDRAYRTRVTGKSIAEEYEEEDAAAWVQKSRVIEEQNKKKERELALKKLNDLDNDEGKSYTSKDLAGIKVANDMSKLEEPVILTLKDTSILKDARQLNEDDDELENIHLTEHEKLNKNKELKKKKPVYNVYDTENKSLLSQYDDPREKEKFVIGSKGNIQSENTIDEADSIRKKLLGDYSVHNLDSEKKFANAYMTAEEMAAKFKKKTTIKKKKNMRVKKESELISDDTQNDAMAIDSISEVNHGSRNAEAKVKIDQHQKEAAEKERRDKNYARALDKANETSENVFNGMRVKIEDEDKDFVSSLPKTKTKMQDADAVAKIVLERNKKQEQEDLYGNGNADPALITNATTEFVNRVQPIEEILGKPEKKKKRDKKKDKDVDMTDEIEEHEKMLREQLTKQKKENKIRPREQFEEVKPQSDQMETDIKPDSTSQEDQSDQSDAEDSDDDNGGGIASTLALIQKTGVKKTEEELEVWIGRKTDKTLEEEYIRKPGFLKGDPKLGKEIRLEYVDDNGRQLTPKEAFRHLSYRFHGKKPGKNKLEKRNKQLEEDNKRKNMSAGETPLNTVEAMTNELEKTQNPYITLSGLVPVENDIVLEKKNSKKQKSK